MKNRNPTQKEEHKYGLEQKCEHKYEREHEDKQEQKQSREEEQDGSMLHILSRSKSKIASAIITSPSVKNEDKEIQFQKGISTSQTITRSIHPSHLPHVEQLLQEPHLGFPLLALGNSNSNLHMLPTTNGVNAMNVTIPTNRTNTTHITPINHANTSNTTDITNIRNTIDPTNNGNIVENRNIANITDTSDITHYMTTTETKTETSTLVSPCCSKHDTDICRTKYIGKKKDSVHIIEKIHNSIANKSKMFSVEFFPPRTAAGVDNLYARIDRFSNLEPVFMDITWGAGGTTGDLTLEMSSTAQNFSIAEIMMHLTCTNMSYEKIINALRTARRNGIRNILALRGDPPQGEERWVAVEAGLNNAVDLVRLIRREHGDYFGIAVAGYPEKHLEAESLEEDIRHLKEKVDAGADFIITQLFYDIDNFFSWVEKCRDAGIICPIIPGIMPIQNYAGFKKMTTLCKTVIPKDIPINLEPIKDNDAAVKDFGVSYCTEMCKRLLAHPEIHGIHFYTINLEQSVIRILENLGWINSDKQLHRLPWRCSQAKRRASETVRPIFWSNRSNVYLQRTTTWDEFPNGRWGDTSSPAFGDLADYHLCPAAAGTLEERTRIWGGINDAESTTIVDIQKVFLQYIEGNIKKLPWCESPINAETVLIKDNLKYLIEQGFLMINSQPRINAASSEDEAVGWGDPDGYIYQKAYLEFFVSPSNLDKLIDRIEKYEKSFSYTAMNVVGDKKSSFKGENVTAVTWGVFPGKEIQQPTIVDTASFVIWKSEAFTLWLSQWQKIYPPNSKAWNLIQYIHDTYYLVCIIDNNYIDGDIFSIFHPKD